jgi:light-regulated signal transduction histidine kinase (bacteriophytochrome)
MLPPESRHHLERIEANSQRMQQLIEDLLSFSRMLHKPVRREPVDMTALARTVYEELVAVEPARQIRCEIADMPACEADPSLLRQVYVNLISNALKFTRACVSAQITVGSQQRGTETVYVVRDNGVGFDMHYADRLFQPFQRLHSQDEYEGTGVGLAIVAQIIRRHAGQVWAESQVNGGTSVCFTLPAAPEEAPGYSE